jgi:hypothetical protein
MRIVFLLCLCLAATSVHANDSRWIVDKTTGCKIWNYLPAFDVKSTSWSGWCDEGIANGKGVLIGIFFYRKPNGSNQEIRDTFEGFLKNGKFDGQGNLTDEWVDSHTSKYTGEFKNGNKEGQGTYSVYNIKGENTYKYVGEFKDGKHEGRGIITKANGDQIVGEFDFFGTGEGTLIEANGDQYVGEFKGGEKHGKGKFIFKGGSSYEGLWENGKRIKIF